MSDEKQIREIEKKIDEFYKGSAFIQTYKGNRRQALFELLRVYECLSITAVLSGIGEEVQGFENPEQVIFQSAHNLQDALSTAVQWIYNDCEEKNVPLSYNLDHTATMATIMFLINYADPYAVISDGYISYSRKNNTGRVDNNRVIFDSTDSQLSSFAIDVGDRLNEDNSSFENSINATMLSADFQSALNALQNSIVIKNERLSYQIPENLKELCRRLAERHWNYKSTVPQNWNFDNFSLREFKNCWIELYVICAAHFAVKLKSNIPGFAYRDGVICINGDELLNKLQHNTNIEREHIKSILKFLTYDPSLRNTDIMYQPLIEVGDSYLIAPNLILASNPERNMLSVIQKKKDSKYSVEVNNLENIMCDELASVLPERTLYKTNCKIGKDNPDVDFAIYDSVSNSILVAEMKWLIAADSSKEVFERQKDIDHGCLQVEKIMTCAMTDSKEFARNLFNIDVDSPDIFWCVIVKHDIRSTSKHVPVISINTIEELFKQYSLSTVFHKIRNREYYKPLPPNTKFGHKKVKYAGYEFWIPALVIEKRI